MQWQCHAPLFYKFVHRRFLSCFNPCFGNTFSTSRFDNLRIMRIQDQFNCIFVNVLFIFCCCHFLNFIHVVEYNAYIAHTTYACFSTDLRQAIFQTWVTEYAFFSFIGFPVVEDFFVWARWNTMSPTAAYILRYENHTIFVAFIDGARWTCSYTCRVQAVVTKTRQVAHEYFFVVKYDIFAHLS